MSLFFIVHGWILSGQILVWSCWIRESKKILDHRVRRDQAKSIRQVKANPTRTGIRFNCCRVPSIFSLSNEEVFLMPIWKLFFQHEAMLSLLWTQKISSVPALCLSNTLQIKAGNMLSWALPWLSNLFKKGQFTQITHGWWYWGTLQLLSLIRMRHLGFTQHKCKTSGGRWCSLSLST